MKNFTTKTTKNDKVITISVMVDNKTAKMLEQLDEQTRHEYILAEHELNLKERKETRRHQSLDLSLENGHEFISEDSTPEEKCIQEEAYANLHNAISSLEPNKQKIVYLYFFENKTMEEIAAILNVQKPAISKQIARILEKLKKVLQ